MIQEGLKLDCGDANAPSDPHLEQKGTSAQPVLDRLKRIRSGLKHMTPIYAQSLLTKAYDDETTWHTVVLPLGIGNDLARPLHHRLDSLQHQQYLPPDLTKGTNK